MNTDNGEKGQVHPSTAAVRLGSSSLFYELPLSVFICVHLWFQSLFVPYGTINPNSRNSRVVSNNGRPTTPV